MTYRYGVTLDGDASGITAEAELAAAKLRALGNTADTLAREETAAAAAAERFVQSLQRQVAEAGRSETELLALRAAELGVAEAAKPLIAQIEAANIAKREQAEAAATAARAERELQAQQQAAADAERRQLQTQQAFIDGLQREADAIGKTRAQLLEMRAAQLGVTAQAQPLIQRLAAADKTVAGLGKTGRLSALELQQVAYQLNDFGVQVASGQNPLVALVQQGSQLSGTFGGIGGAVRALGSLITPTVVGLGGLAAVLAAVSVAAIGGYTETAKLERQLLLTGNRAGVTASEVTALSHALADSSLLTVGAARDAVQATIAAGDFGAASLGAAAKAAGVLADRTGEAVDSVVKDLGSRLRDGVAKGAADLNRQYNFLSGAQFRYIRELEAAGNVEEARRETLRLLAEQIGRKTPTELGLLETALDKTKKAWSSFWDAAFNIGRPKTIAEEIETAMAAVEGARSRLEAAESKGPNNKADAERKRQRYQEAQERLAALREQQRNEGRAAQEQAAAASAAREDIARQSQSFVDSQLAVQRAQLGKQQAQSDLARARELDAVEQQYARLEISAQQYVARRAAIEQAGINARLRALDAEIALERARVPDSTGDKTAQEGQRLQQQARLVELETRRSQILQDQVRLQAQLREGFGIRPREVQETPQADFRRQELEQGEAVRKAYDDRTLAARQNARELLLVNAGLSRDLIRDERARGEALIAAEAEELRRRLDAEALAGEERKAAEDAIADYVVLRNRQLTEELKPEWQRMLEGWQDVNRLMRETSDQFQTEFLRSSEDAFAEFVKTGSLSLKDLGDLAVDTTARNLFRTQFAPAVGAAGNGLARLLGFGPGTPAEGTGDASQTVAQQAQTAALMESTAALQLFTGSLGGNVTQTQALDAAAREATGGVGAFGQQLGGLGGIFVQAGQAVAAFIAAAGSNAGGGGGTSGLLGSIASMIGSFLGTPGSVNTDFVGGQTGDFARMDRLAYDGARAKGGPTRPGTFVEVTEQGPELYSTGGRTYLIDPDPGYVTPTSPGTQAAAAAGKQGAAQPPAVNLQVEIVNKGTPQRETGREMTQDGRLRLYVEDLVAESISNGGKVGRAIAGRYGANSAATMKR